MGEESGSEAMERLVYFLIFFVILWMDEAPRPKFVLSVSPGGELFVFLQK